MNFLAASAYLNWDYRVRDPEHCATEGRGGRFGVKGGAGTAHRKGRGDGGFTGREDIAERCSEKGAEISARSVSRYLKALTDKGLLQRLDNGYAPTEQARKQPRKDTL